MRLQADQEPRGEFGLVARYQGVVTLHLHASGRGRFLAAEARR